MSFIPMFLKSTFSYQVTFAEYLFFFVCFHKIREFFYFPIVYSSESMHICPIEHEWAINYCTHWKLPKKSNDVYLAIFLSTSLLHNPCCWSRYKNKHKTDKERKEVEVK